MDYLPRCGKAFQAAAVCLINAVLFVPVTLSAQTPTIEDLAWISGDWEAVSGRTRISEHWTQVAGKSMLGMSRTVAGETTVFFEYLRIESRPDGIYYVAHPKARPGVDFKLSRLQGQEVLFENPKHDHPKRILYRKNADGSLSARIEGDEKGKPVAQDFHFRPLKKN